MTIHFVSAEHHAEVVAERDALAAKLAEVSEALRAYPSAPAAVALDRAHVALASAPLASLARVRAGVLEAAADDVRRGTEDGGYQDGAPFIGDTLPEDIEAWLRARAEKERA